MKKKVAYIALVVVISLAVLCAAYIIFHMNCSTEHLAKHIRLGMTYDQVVKLVGEPDWVFHRDMKFDLGNDNHIMILFDSESDKLNTATVNGFWYRRQPKAEIGWILGTMLLVSAVIGTAAVLISRKIKPHTTEKKNIRHWFVARKSKLAYSAIVISISIILLCAASIIFHMNCSTDHLAKHLHLGMSYHDMVKLLGEPDNANNAMTTATYGLQNNHRFRVHLWPNERNGRYTEWEECIVQGYAYEPALPKAEIGLIVGGALLICLVSGIDAFLIRRKWKQPD